VEIQGTAEGKTFDRAMLDSMLDAAESAIRTITAIQKESLGI
jgi:ribonuclease PH